MIEIADLFKTTRRFFTGLAIGVSAVFLLSSCMDYKEKGEGEDVKYKVDYSGQKSQYSNAEDSYPAGEEVELHYEFIATDTDYTFYLDGEYLTPEWDESIGYVLRFTMPEHDVKLEVETKNTMTYIPPEPEEGLSPEEIREMKAGSVLTEEDMTGIDPDDLFTSSSISDQVFERMKGNSFGEGCSTKREELRYLRVLHLGFDNETHIGEIVCHRDIAEDLLDIFRELYREAYPIEKILLVDEYGGDDELSMEDNNTSSFNFRPVAGTKRLSQHAYGRAIDINPLYNPYITSEGYTPVNAGDYVDQSAENPHKIDEDDLCFRLFEEKGFFWGGHWKSVKDYQHFQREE